MEMEKNQRKRLIIISIYAAILIAIIWGIFSLFRPDETCQDGIKNQNEEDIDCGGICAKCQKITAQPLTTGEGGIIPGGSSGAYDFYGIVVNPNNIYGANRFRYALKIKDGSGAVLEERKGESYILPGERKYILETNIRPSSGAPSGYEFTVSDVSWVEFKSYYEKPDISIVNKHYSEISGGIGFSEATGLLKNNSPFDFELIGIAILLKDSQGKIVALNPTQMRTVKSKEERDFRAFWPNRFPGDVRDIITQVEVNIFDSQTFIKQFSAQ